MSEHRCWVYGDNINTDVIFPGKYTYNLKTPKEIAAHALEDLDPTFVQGVRPGDVIVAGRNWGMGSSREQAVTTLKYVGVNIIIAASFSGLYFRNCINQGVLPLVCAELHRIVQTGGIIQIDLKQSIIQTGGNSFPFPSLSPSVQAIMDAGGLLPMLQKRFSASTEG